MQPMHELRERGGLELVEAFVAVAELGGFSAAASRVGRDASIVSRRVGQLEQQLGVRLFSRTTRQVALTEAGRLYLRRVQGVLDELSAANAEVSAQSDTIRGTLRITVPIVFGQLWIAPVLPKFSEQFPQLSVETNFTDRFVDIVGDGFDIAVRIGSLQSSSLNSRRVAEKRYLLCASPAYIKRHDLPRSPQELTNHKCIGFLGHSFWPDWPLQKGDQAYSFKPKGTFFSDNATACLLAAEHGIGISLLADWLAWDALRSGRLVEVLSGWTIKGDGGVYVVMPPGKLTPAKIRAFSDFIAVELQGGEPWRVKPRHKR